MKKSLLVLFPVLWVVGCATDSGDPGALSGIGARPGAVGATGGKAPGDSDRDLLRKSKRLYDTAVGDAGWEGETAYSGRVKVYRWGQNATVPVEQYAWDAEAGERWHCVRETCGGKPESCGRNGVPPIDEFYSVDDMNVSLVGVARSVPATVTGLAATTR